MLEILGPYDASEDDTGCCGDDDGYLARIENLKGIDGGDLLCETRYPYEGGVVSL